PHDQQPHDQQNGQDADDPPGPGRQGIEAYVHDVMLSYFQRKEIVSCRIASPAPPGSPANRFLPENRFVTTGRKEAGKSSDSSTTASRRSMRADCRRRARFSRRKCWLRTTTPPSA